VHGLNFDDFVAGLKAMLQGEKLAISMEEAGEALEQFYKEMEEEASERAAAAGAAAKEEGEKFLAKAARDPEVRATGSGLMYKVLKEGTGKKPKATSQVKCHYEGTFPNGQIFDSSYKRGEPAVFGLNQVIKGWTEGLQLMAEGSKYELYLPYDLAYGERGAGNAIPPYSALKFVVELIEVL
jgi:FKBP-type peptidyl-prolyl cis-trans isomerase FklB